MSAGESKGERNGEYKPTRSSANEGKEISTERTNLVPELFKNHFLLHCIANRYAIYDGSLVEKRFRSSLLTSTIDIAGGRGREVLYDPQVLRQSTGDGEGDLAAHPRLRKEEEEAFLTVDPDGLCARGILARMFQRVWLKSPSLLELYMSDIGNNVDKEDDELDVDKEDDELDESQEPVTPATILAYVTRASLDARYAVEKMIAYFNMERLAERLQEKRKDLLAQSTDDFHLSTDNFHLKIVQLKKVKTFTTFADFNNLAIAIRVLEKKRVLARAAAEVTDNVAVRYALRF